MYTEYIQDVSKLYTTFQQAFVYIFFVYKIKRTMSAKFCMQNVYKNLSKYGYILYTNILYTFCINQF